MMHTSIRRSVTLLGLFLLSLLPAACKEGNPLTGGISPADAAFTPQTRPAGVTSNYVSLRESSVDGGRIVFDIVVSDVDTLVTGIALKLTYPDTFSRFVKCTDGSLFSSGTCYFAEPSVGSGEVFIGRSITDPAQATLVSGDQVVVRLEFLVFGEGSGPIVIEGQNLGGGDASALLGAGGATIFVNWYSGTMQGE